MAGRLATPAGGPERIRFDRHHADPSNSQANATKPPKFPGKEGLNFWGSCEGDRVIEFIEEATFEPSAPVGQDAWRSDARQLPARRCRNVLSSFVGAAVGQPVGLSDSWPDPPGEEEKAGGRMEELFPGDAPENLWELDAEVLAQPSIAHYSLVVARPYFENGAAGRLVDRGS